VDERVSIIVPVLNEAEGIAATLQALQPCRRDGAELIVVDGGSTDATLARCAGLADQLLSSARGRARQMNTGAQAATGTLLLFLHADTRLPDAALNQLRRALASGEHDWGRFDVAIEGNSRLFPLIAWMMNRRSRLTGIATGDQAMFVRCASFDAVGGFVEQPLMEDIELSRRLRRRGRPACLKARVVTSGRRWEKHGVGRTILLMWRLRLLYWLGVSPQRLAQAYR
jgi:rSAM/selenodomain-associated transferase 2